MTPDAVVRVATPAGDDVPADEEDHGEHDEGDDEDGEQGHRADYSSTLRAARCVPTLRFTRCSALSTVLVSQPIRSPTCS